MPQSRLQTVGVEQQHRSVASALYDEQPVGTNPFAPVTEPARKCWQVTDVGMKHDEKVVTETVMFEVSCVMVKDQQRFRDRIALDIGPAYAVRRNRSGGRRTVGCADMAATASVVLLPSGLDRFL